MCITHTGFILAGHANLDLDGTKQDDGMVVNRNRENTVLVGDSGGYQIGSGAWKLDWSNFENGADWQKDTLWNYDLVRGIL